MRQDLLGGTTGQKRDRFSGRAGRKAKVLTFTVILSSILPATTWLREQRRLACIYPGSLCGRES